MRTTGVVLVNGIGIYGLVVSDAHEVRLRVPEAEWRTVGVEAGQVVGVRLPDRAEAALLVTGVTRVRTGGTVWVHFGWPVG